MNASICTIKAEGDGWQIDFPNDDEMQKCIQIAVNVIGTKRRGFSIDIRGSMCKGPQGINWFITIEFEDAEDSRIFHDRFFEYISYPLIPCPPLTIVRE